jgi:regulator of RNase E activity RraA
VVEVDRSTVDELVRFSTPSVLNGLKRLGVHPSRLESLDRLAIRCTSPDLGRRVGFAATRKVATSTEGPTKQASAPNRRADEHILTVPEPRILVAENVGDWKGPVCIWGEVAANLYMALGCTGGVTNGPVRDIEEMEQAGFQTFAGGPGVGGGFVDVLEVGEPVEVGGVTIASGDLIHADRHGVVKVPLELAAALPDAIRAVEETERRVIDVCRSPQFSLEAFAAAWSAEPR